MRVSTNPTPNVRVSDLPVDPGDPLDLWALERQAAGIEPSELALKRSIDFHSPVPDPVIAVLLIVFAAFVLLDVYASLTFLWEVAR